MQFKRIFRLKRKEPQAPKKKKKSGHNTKVWALVCPFEGRYYKKLPEQVPYQYVKSLLKKGVFKDKGYKWFRDLLIKCGSISKDGKRALKKSKKRG